MSSDIANTIEEQQIWGWNMVWEIKKVIYLFVFLQLDTLHQLWPFIFIWWRGFCPPLETTYIYIYTHNTPIKFYGIHMKILNFIVKTRFAVARQAPGYSGLRRRSSHADRENPWTHALLIHSGTAALWDELATDLCFGHETDGCATPRSGKKNPRNQLAGAPHLGLEPAPQGCYWER
jgi:hypothetical protein